MSTFYIVLTLFLLANMAAAMARVFRGPTTADRLMTAQLFGTTGVGILVLLAEATPQPALRDVALVFTLLAVLVVLAFTRGQSAGGEEARNPGKEGTP
ncbi:MAG: hypothetical protein JJU00_09380 [Opitutales bacterium]|nr:hypothetical protein [Opitutales bacterium]